MPGLINRARYPYVGWALEAARVSQSDRNDGKALERVKEHLEEIEPMYRRLTGKKPQDAPFPIYITVTAEHEDGQQKAGLAHSYLIEVPLRSIQAVMSRR